MNTQLDALYRTIKGMIKKIEEQWKNDANIIWKFYMINRKRNVKF